MKEKIIFLVFIFSVGYIYDQGLFRMTERRCCKKSKGDCSKCKAWSCYKGNLELKKEKSDKK